ncbi:GGDEF domain-containing protein [uncultured Pseudacidovorax sp.]|uniref:GGDEF domain-containing protein n=1 Tax=uncultured Pseudacidovorax sp. TaxID=679313 RepID=UPI0025E30D6B|nr:GGDEF domain-containing protein [uncultured Pseudacidovorax sp.]
MDDAVFRQLSRPARALGGVATLCWLLSLWAAWPHLAGHVHSVCSWSVVQAAGLVLCFMARDVGSHDGGMGLLTVAIAAGCAFQLDVLGGSELWVLPLCLMLSLVLGLVQVRLRSYLFCSFAVWSVLLHGLSFGLDPVERALRVVLLVGSFVLALLLHRGVAVARRRRVAAALSLTAMAYQDALTGVPNRRGFVRAASERLGGTEAQGFIALDVDDFKRVNDCHGHEVGDLLLQAVGRLLSRLPPGVVPGRTGGEEFCVLVPAPSHAGLLTYAGAIVEAARRVSVQGVGLTLSAGAARVMPGEALEQAWRRADGALNEAKRTGKNRVVMAPEGAT